MKKNDIIKKIGGKLSKVGLKLKKHSPEILVAVGIAGTVTSAVLACKATTKASTILEETKETVDQIHECMENETLKGEYTPEDSKKNMTIVYAQTGVKFVKLYAPAVLLGAASITCIVASHNILRKRNIAMAAAYAAVDKSFKDYRKRVVERFGEDVDHELRYNIKQKTVAETIIDENGEENTVEKTIKVADVSAYSEFARCFDDGCAGWEKDSEYNLMFLRAQQQYANDLLKSRGHLFLNEVYDMLGFPRSTAGQVVGWVYDEKDPNRANYVDFGIYNADNEKARDFVNGYERSIWLDFNVDGVIYDLI